MPKKKKRTQRRKKSTRRAPVQKKSEVLEALELKAETRRHIRGYVQLAVAAILFLVLRGSAGMIGEWARDFIVFFFGSGGIVLPIALTISGLFLIFREDGNLELRSTLGLTLCLVSVLGFIHIQAPFLEIGEQRDALGGAIGFMVAFPLLGFASLPVAYVVLTAAFLIGLLITFDLSFADVATGVSKVKERLEAEEEEEEEAPKRRRKRKDDSDVLEEGMEEVDEEAGAKPKGRKKKKAEDPAFNIVRPEFAKAEVEKKVEKKEKPKVVKMKNEDDIEMSDTRFDDWEFPSLDCLNDARSEVMVDDETLQEQAKRIQQKLKEFDINVTMREAHPGPTVTQFALEPAEGVKLSRIANLKSDLALALAAPSLRIEAPIPGKSLVGLEMPNEKRTTVHLRELLESPEFRESESPLTLPFGRDVGGGAIVRDLAEMPHLMIAGATGSGKSVCMNTFLLSLLYQNAPHELKLILVDPKRVELALYENIPHLLTPVITEAERALKALRWAVAEMGRRLARFSEVGARNLQEFNDKQDDETKQLPRIVIVIDELADLMMRQYRRDTEMMITRIAQIARATGMHMILATQRPSVDVITGIIKANIPTRIAFRTVSSIDSRTILDHTGSEDLLGKGDMLYIDAVTPVPMRVQGIFVSSEETERVINQVKIAGGGRLTAEIPLQEDEEDASTGLSTGEGPQIIGDAEVMDPPEENVAIDLDADDDGGDDLTFEAIDLVRQTGKASASLLQRHLKVGYARAARILDILEEKGVVGPADGAKPRKVYVQPEAKAA